MDFKVAKSERLEMGDEWSRIWYRERNDSHNRSINELMKRIS